MDKNKCPNQTCIIFQPLMPFIIAHGFSGLKFIQNGFQNSLMKAFMALEQ